VTEKAFFLHKFPFPPPLKLPALDVYSVRKDFPSFPKLFFLLVFFPTFRFRVAYSYFFTPLSTDQKNVAPDVVPSSFAKFRFFSQLPSDNLRSFPLGQEEPAFPPPFHLLFSPPLVFTPQPERNRALKARMLLPLNVPQASPLLHFPPRQPRFQSSPSSSSGKLVSCMTLSSTPQGSPPHTKTALFLKDPAQLLTNVGNRPPSPPPLDFR